MLGCHVKHGVERARVAKTLARVADHGGFLSQPCGRGGYKSHSFVVTPVGNFRLQVLFPIVSAIFGGKKGVKIGDSP